MFASSDWGKHESECLERRRHDSRNSGWQGEQRRLLPTRVSGRNVDVSCAQGVYIIRDPSGFVEHVGRTCRGKGGLRQRFRDHLGGSSSFTKKHLQGLYAKLRSGYTFQCLEIEESRKRALVEHLAVGLLCPKHLGDGASQAEELLHTSAKSQLERHVSGTLLPR
jgi:hypothetical protein